MTVPKPPSTASVMWSSEVMTLRGPPPSTNRVAASTLGPMEPDANWPSAACAAHLGEGDAAEVALPRGAPVDGGVVDVGGDDEHVGVEGAGEQGGREVLVDDGLDPADAAVRVADDGDAAPAGGDDDVAGGEQGTRRRRRRAPRAARARRRRAASPSRRGPPTPGRARSSAAPARGGR